MPDSDDKEEINRRKAAPTEIIMQLGERIMGSDSNTEHNDDNPAPASRQFTVRRSIDTPTEYEIFSQDDINDVRLENSIKSKSVPSVKMKRLESINPKRFENGLAPNELALISSSAGSSISPQMIISQDEEYEDQIEEEEEEEEEMTVAAEEVIIEKEEVYDTQEQYEESVLEESTALNNDESTEKIDTSIASTTSNGSSTVFETIAPSKMNREMRNLQKSSNDSKVLTDFLTVADTSRNRNRKAKETSNERDSVDLNSLSSRATEKEVPLKDSGNDSDSTIVMNDDVVKRRRKSLSRSRSRASSRAKSVSSRRRKSATEEMDRSELKTDDEVEDDDIGEAPYIAKLIENRAPNPPPKIGWDSFCFKCHADTAVLSLTCRKCKCSYHRHCARLLSTPIPKNPEEFICIDCIEIDKAKHSNLNKYNHPKIEPYMLKEMLTTILEKIRTYNDRDFFENDIQFKSSTKENTQPLIITQMSFKRIEERVISTYYRVSEAFLHDIKQLEHNWTIVDRNKLKSLKLILKFVNTEINEMEACVHCFSNAFVVNNWFTAPCKRPHLLIWAKLKGYPFWPAKVMSLDSAKENVDVRFFGAHDRAWVPVSHCLLFSDKDPNKVGKASTPTNNKSKNQKGIADAMREKDEYIKNMSNKYGFRYSSAREILDPQKFQSQLEYQLPSLNKDAKLTMKIIKTPDGTPTIEKTPKISDKERPPQYMVLSRNEENNEVAEQQSRVKAIILKRSTDGDKEKSRSRNTSLSETSESNISSVSGTSQRRKSIREPTKRRKSLRMDTPEPEKKKQRRENDESGGVLAAVSLQRRRRSRQKSRETPPSPLIVTASRQTAIPPGTNEIYQLNEEVPSSSAKRTTKRSQSFNRSHEKDRKDKSRRLSSASTPSKLNHVNVAPLPRKNVTTTSAISVSSTPATSKRPSMNEEANSSEIAIKVEPISDDEEIVSRGQVTINDLADLVNDSSNKRKTILISTSDNSNDSYQHQVSRARKSFPKPLCITHTPPADSPQPQQQSQMRNSASAMVCIPQVFSINDSSSSSTTNTQTTRPLSSNQTQPQTTNGIDNNNDASRVAINSLNQPEITVTQRTQNTPPSTSSELRLPQLVPRPSGVFTSEGSTFQRESGDVAALFSQNAHRMTDYFKSLLVDTIEAISNGVSDAENVILKLENEKLKQQIASLKTENQQRIDKMRRDHSIEMNTTKASYEEKIKSIHIAQSEDKVRLIKDIRTQCEIEKQRAIEATRRETKKMTWCSNCTKEARFYCCWNTSYCGPACQKSHWQQHIKCCTNRNSNNSSEANAGNKQQQQVDAPASVTLANLAANNNRQYHQQNALPKQPSPQMLQQQHIIAHPNAAISHLESTLLRGNTKPQQTILLNNRGQQIIQTQGGLPPQFQQQQQFLIHQQKIPSANLKTSLIPIPPLVNSTESKNLVVRTVPRNNSPQLTVISTNPSMNDIIITSQMENSPHPSTTQTAKILNHTVISSNGKSLG